MDRRWGIVFGLNFLGISLALAIVAWWERELLFGRGIAIATIGALGFTFRQWARPWWTTQNADESIWRMRYVHDAAIWGVVLVVLILVLLKVGHGNG